jgi:lipopolysaccharide/colanic/teichoic acid biosynthesis glycosyltransferase
MLDVAVASIGLAVFGIPLLLLMLLVRLTSRGPALFAQVRLGEGGQPFVMYKLRTMRLGSVGPDVTAAEDVRVTPLGARLRRSSLDELPQLWNVLRGDMTLVGPRPETPGLASRYPQDCQWILRYRPGMTGPAQVRLRDSMVLTTGSVVDENSYLHQLVPARVAMDAAFLGRPSMAATVSVLADTVRHLIGKPARPVATVADGIVH